MCKWMRCIFTVMAACTLCPTGFSESAEDIFIDVMNDGASSSSLHELPGDPAFSYEVLPQAYPVDQQRKRILIYHTHTYEAYEQSTDDIYRETERWRTDDPDHNVVAVGRALSAALKTYGIDVVHDTTKFEPPTLDSAYQRSLQMLQNRISQGERYDLYLDIHRDAIADTSNIKRTVQIGDLKIARFMVLVGKGTTGGYAEKPDWEENLRIAQMLTDHLNMQCSNLARNVKVKTGRYNQHIDEGCILIECGMNSNTLDEVLAGIPYLAQAISETLTDMESLPASQ